MGGSMHQNYRLQNSAADSCLPHDQDKFSDQEPKQATKISNSYLRDTPKILEGIKKQIGGVDLNRGHTWSWWDRAVEALMDASRWHDQNQYNNHNQIKSGWSLPNLPRRRSR
jgi:hypothetical protein